MREEKVEVQAWLGAFPDAGRPRWGGVLRGVPTSLAAGLHQSDGVRIRFIPSGEERRIRAPEMPLRTRDASRCSSWARGRSRPTGHEWGGWAVPVRRDCGGRCGLMSPREARAATSPHGRYRDAAQHPSLSPSPARRRHGHDIAHDGAVCRPRYRRRNAAATSDQMAYGPARATAPQPAPPCPAPASFTPNAGPTWHQAHKALRRAAQTGASAKRQLPAHGSCPADPPKR